MSILFLQHSQALHVFPTPPGWSAIVYGQKKTLQSALYGTNDLSRPVLYKSLRPECKYVQCLSSVQCFKQKVDHKDPGVVAMDCM